MFPLHDRTRRSICRWTFFVAGVLPTVSVLAWTMSVNSAGHLAGVRERLENVLGMEVHLAGVAYPRPDAMQLEGLELADRETGKPLLRARLVEATTADNTLTLIASQPEIEAAQFDRLWTLVARQLHHRDDVNQPAIHLAASELTVRWPSGRQTFIGCNAEITTGDTTGTVTAVCRTADAQSSEPIRLKLQRASRSGETTTSIEADNTNTPLSCALLAALTGCENRLGKQSVWRGTIEADETPDGWHGEISGKLTGVDLHAAVSDQFPHQLGGTAELNIQHAVFHAGRLETAEGDLHAGPGLVSTSLLQAAVEALGMQPGVVANIGGSIAAYEELAAGFTIDAKGLAIHGRCGDRQSHVLMTSKDGELFARFLARPAADCLAGESPGARQPGSSAGHAANRLAAARLARAGRVAARPADVATSAASRIRHPLKK